MNVWLRVCMIYIYSIYEYIILRSIQPLLLCFYKGRAGVTNWEFSTCYCMCLPLFPVLVKLSLFYLDCILKHRNGVNRICEDSHLTFQRACLCYCFVSEYWKQKCFSNSSKFYMFIISFLLDTVQSLRWIICSYKISNSNIDGPK